MRERRGNRYFCWCLQVFCVLLFGVLLLFLPVLYLCNWLAVRSVNCLESICVNICANRDSRSIVSHYLILGFDPLEIVACLIEAKVESDETCWISSLSSYSKQEVQLRKTLVSFSLAHGPHRHILLKLCILWFCLHVAMTCF